MRMRGGIRVPSSIQQRGEGRGRGAMVSLQVPGGLEQLTKEITKDCYVFGSSSASASTLRKSPGKLLVTEEDEEQHPRTTSVLGLGLTCSICGKVFEDRDHQAAHFKTDYHRFNVKRQQKGSPK